jgi:hypothetical protein
MYCVDVNVVFNLPSITLRTQRSSEILLAMMSLLFNMLTMISMLFIMLAMMSMLFIVLAMLAMLFIVLAMISPPSH